MKFQFRSAVLVVVLILAIDCKYGMTETSDISRLGGDLSSTLPERHAIQVAAPNVSDRTRFEKQLSGFPVFHSLLSSPEGLGPHFVNNSCGGCHINNGRGPAKFSRGITQGSTMVVKVSVRGKNPDGSPKDVPGIGEQIQDHSVTGKRTASVTLKWIPVTGRYPDKRPYTLRKPDLSISLTGRSSRGILSSLRMTPALIGLGLLDGVSEGTILERADPADADKDGISGEPQYVIDAKTKEKRLGKFGFRASHTTTEEQSAAAAFFDMGVTSSLFPGETATTELTDDNLDRLTFYQNLAGVPFARDQESPTVVAGRARFDALGCEKCHRATMTTGEVPGYPELSNQTFHPFSDLLLHDMGPGLADKRSEFEASGREWRTTPLWGLGYSYSLSSVKPLFLHDGRARTIEEAILWHGGEAEGSKKAFMKLKKAERDELIAFLRSL
jgi:CxxC motif-containing protein (DUF1111 family)